MGYETDQDLDLFLADFGVPVSFTGAPAGAVGIVEFVDVGVLDDAGRSGVVGRRRSVRLKTSVATLLSPGMPITVDGTAYVADQPFAEGNGAFSVVMLRSS